MKIKVAEATEAQLNLLAAQGMSSAPPYGWDANKGAHVLVPFATNESMAAMLIAKALISVSPVMQAGTGESGQEAYSQQGWQASATPGAYWMTRASYQGKTWMEAVTRAFVAWKFGREVEFTAPDEAAEFFNDSAKEFS